MLKKLLIAVGVLAFLLGVFAVVVASRPADFTLSRSATIDVTPAQLFPYINDLHKGDQWSPWNKLDPNMKKTFDGPAAGVGAVHGWEGNDQAGSGRMTIIESNPDQSVKLKLEFFKPFAATNTVDYVIAPEGDDKSSIKWSMSGTRSFMEKAVCMFMDMEKMVGPQFEEGLANLKKLAESEAKAGDGADDKSSQDNHRAETAGEASQSKPEPKP